MPTKPGSRCTADPTCPILSPNGGACDEHRRQRAAARRTSDDGQAFYRSAAWRRLSARVRREQPTCATAWCDQPSEHADHIIPIDVRPDLRLVRSNVRGLCRPHHSSRTAIDNDFGISEHSRAMPRRAGGVG